METMLLKLIACNVFMREVSHGVARTPHIVDVEFTELGEHIHSETLRGLIQSRIDAAGRSGKAYEAVLLAFGICGNAAVGLRARGVPLVIPRAHDCCTILLGSRAAFKEHFADNPSMPFSSAGYIERGQYFLRQEDGENRIAYGDAYAEYVKQYGEENARYIWEQMHPPHADGGNRAVFIDIPETSHLGYWDQFRQRAAADGKEALRLPGSLRLIEGLLAGNWNDEDFLVVPPGQRVAGLYDWERVVKAE
jgi:hypothetical protein